VERGHGGLARFPWAVALAVREHEIDAAEPPFIGIQEDAADIAVAVENMVVMATAFFGKPLLRR
jgi:hypothetical protein